MKPRLVPVLIYRHLWSGERLPEPVLGWACEGWIDFKAWNAYFMWSYDGPKDR